MDRRTTAYRLAFTLDALADATGLKVRHLRVAAERGDLPAFKVGRKWLVREESFRAWAAVQEQRQQTSIRRHRAA